MKARPSPSPDVVKPVIFPMRVLFIAALVLAFIAGIQLYILTDYTNQYFAWTIAQPLSATLLGSGYWAGCVLVILALREAAWARIRVALAAIVAFVPILVITTFLHLDRFHLQSTDSTALVAAWAWIIVYVTVPILTVVVLVLQLRASSNNPPREAPVAFWLRILVGINATAALAIGLGLFFAPQLFFPLWPWTLTALTAQANSGVFLSIAAASFEFIRENDWKRGRVGTASYVLLGGLQLVAIARYAGTIEWNRPGAWLYLVFVISIFCGGIYSLIAAWKPPSRQKVALVD